MDRAIRSLTRHYPRRDETVVQVLAVLARFEGLLNPEQSDFTYDDGRVELLLSLTGVLPIPIQANTYHCPIAIWLPLDFPSIPPIVFVLPSETLAVRKGKNVDAGGRVNVQYLDQWSRKSEGCSLLALIEELIPLFSARYPVTTIQQKVAPRPPPVPVSQSTASSATQAVSPRPPLPAGSPASNSRSTADETGPRAPPRPPLPATSEANGRPSSVPAADLVSRPTSLGAPANVAPPRPPPPPGSATFDSFSSFPHGPPPGYHPPVNGSSASFYNAPQRSATAAPSISSEPRPPPVPRSLPPAIPTQPIFPTGRDSLLLGPPIAPPPPPSIDPGRRNIPTDLPAGSQSSSVPRLPLPGAFSPPRPPSNFSNHSLSETERGQTSPRPVSYGAQTGQGFSPAKSTPTTVADPAVQIGRQDATRQQAHDRQGFQDEHYVHDVRHAPRPFTGEYPISNQPYSPSQSSVAPPSPPEQPQRSRPRPSLHFGSPGRSYSPAPSSTATFIPAGSRSATNHAHPPPPAQHSQWRDHASATSMSEYNAEYGSYLPPALSSVAVSVAGEDTGQNSPDGALSTATERLSLDQNARGQPPRAPFEPYHPARGPDSRMPQPPLPPSSVFEATSETWNDRRRQSSIDSTSRFAAASHYSAVSSPASIAAPSHQPPPVGNARQPSHLQAPVPQQVMRTLAQRAAPPPSSTMSVNILDAADDDLESPSSIHASTSSSTSIATRGLTAVAPSGGPAPSTSQAHVPPPVPPNPAVLALRTRVHSKLSTALATLHTETTREHLEPLSLMHSDLLKAVPAIEDEMARLRAVRDVCLTVRDRYRQVVDEGEKRMAEYEKKGEGVDVDEIVCGSTVVYTQLLDLVAEDAALEDTIYALGRGLNSGTANIDLDQFLKRVRTLAREQFIKRATINKILLGLAIRRERSQQQRTDAASRTGSGQGGRGTPNVA